MLEGLAIGFIITLTSFRICFSRKNPEEAKSYVLSILCLVVLACLL